QSPGSSIRRRPAAPVTLNQRGPITTTSTLHARNRPNNSSTESVPAGIDRLSKNTRSLPNRADSSRSISTAAVSLSSPRYLMHTPPTDIPPQPAQPPHHATH